MTNVMTAILGFFLFLIVVAWMGPIMKRYPILGALGLVLLASWIGFDKIMAFFGMILKFGIVLFIFAVILATVASYDKNQRDLYMNPEDEDNDKK